MYSFAQRSDTTVVDEPFYACYLSKTDANHPGKEQVLKSQSSDEEVVKKNLFRTAQKPIRFIKNMAHHIEVINDGFLSKCKNIFLIRDPKQLIASYAQVIEKPTMRDIGIEHEYHLYQKTKDPVVIDSGLILQNPESVLKQLCARLELKFEPSMLQWEAGPKPYDGIWAPHWYANVHRSTGFEKQTTSDRPLPAELQPLYQNAAAYYQKLLHHALKP